MLSFHLGYSKSHKRSINLGLQFCWDVPISNLREDFFKAYFILQCLNITSGRQKSEGSIGHCTIFNSKNIQRPLAGLIVRH